MHSRGRSRIVAYASVAGSVAIMAAGCGSSASAKRAGLPAGWSAVRLRSGATLPTPPGWQRVGGDPGTASAAVFNADGTIRAYLNATPAVARETLSGWARFRVRHNAAEGDRHVRLISSRTGVTMGVEHGSCVVDQYATSRTRYRELACLLIRTGTTRADVLVAAAQPAVWQREQATLVYALDHFVG
jgi:hypothetical protein